MLVRELFVLFQCFNLQNRKPRTVEFYELQLGKLCAVYGELDAQELRPHHLLNLVPTWHLCVAVQRLYKWAVAEAGLLPTNPMAGLKRPHLGRRKRTLEPAELLRLLRFARRDFRAFLLAGRETSARPQELREMDWRHLEWEGGPAALERALRAGAAWFYLVEYKGRSRRLDPDEARVIPISPRLGRLLWRLCRGRRRQGLIFKTQRGRAWTRNSLRLRMSRLRRRVDLGQLLRRENICCYTLRHTAATGFAAEEMPPFLLQQLLGHASLRTTQRYLHFSKRQLLEGWKRFLESRK